MDDDRLYIGVLGEARSIPIPDAGTLTIGRGKDSDVQVADPLVSRRHAIVHGGASPAFEELGSKNPSVLVRGLVVEKLSPLRRISLVGGDVFRLGARFLGIHRRDSAVTRVVPDGEAFEAQLDRACGGGDPFAVIRIQLHTTNAELSRAALFGLLDAAQGVETAALGITDLVLLARIAPPAAQLEVQHLATQLSELGVQGVVGLASFPSDGTTAVALLAAASTEVETIRAWAPATPIAIAPRRPAPLTSFVGRASELEQLCARLAEGARLVTVAGPPGVGKSRLVLRHAELDGRPTVFCDLASARDATDICSVLAQALQLPAVRALAEPIGHSLAVRGDVLVVLDNAEHVAGVLAPLLARWLADARDAQFVVTSREILGIAGENAFELGPLAMPAADDDVEADAVRLFCERGRMVRDSMAATAQIVTLVRRLDGMPLALELAAGCLDVYSPAELCARFPERLDALVDPRRQPGSRHHSLRGALDQSWAALDDDERAALATCSVFEGGFSLGALEEIAAAPRSAIVAALRRKSWIRGLEIGGRRRFELYRSIRAYVAATAPPDELYRARHVAFFAGLARAAVDPRSTNASERLGELERDLDNLRAAHRHALDASLDDALAIVIALGHVANGAHAEIQALVDATLSREGPRDPRLALRARIAAARAGHERGTNTRDELATIAVAARALDDEHAEGLALAAHGRSTAAIDPAAAMPLFDAAIERLRAADDPRALAIAAIDCAAVRLALDDVGGARRLLDGAARDAARAGDHALEVMAATQLGNLLVATDRLDEAEHVLGGAIARAGALGDARAEAHASRIFAVLRQESQSFRDAHAYYDRARTLFTRLDDQISLAHVLVATGALHHEQGELAAARTRYQEAIDLLVRANAKVSLAVARSALGASLADLDQIDAAAAVFAEVVGDHATSSADRHAWLCALARAHVDVARARRAEADGNAEAAQMWRARAAGTLDPPGTLRPGPSTRCAQRLLARILPPTLVERAATPGPTLFVGRDARALVLPSGERVDLSRHASLRLLVLGLARRHAGRAPGMTHDDLLACGWPGERVDPIAGNARVRVALSRLRSLGLRDLLIRANDGYVLVPELAIVIEEV